MSCVLSLEDRRFHDNILTLISSSHCLHPSVLHPRCHTIESFIPAVKLPCSSRPASSWPKKRIAQNSSADATNARHLEKPAIPRRTRRTPPLAGQTSVWTTSLLGKGFTAYRVIHISLCTFRHLHLL